MDYRTRYNSWLADESVDQATKAELLGLTDEKEIEDRFYTELEFGTAGIRGVIGAGANRMNKYVIGKATQGYSQYLKFGADYSRGVAIAYDSRNKSDEFAMEAALVLCANSIPVYLFDSIHSVPQLSFALQYYKCIGGIVITASHNPKQYNGYKVYGENGAQIGPDEANEVIGEISRVGSFSNILTMSREEALSGGMLTMIGREVDEAYYSYVESLVVNPGVFSQAGDFKLVYTPLYGSGAVPVTRVLNDLGVKHLHMVKEQSEPNGDFPTVAAPNPESRDAFDLALKLAGEVGADMLLATDPDADRLGVAVCSGDGAFEVLTGNQIGCLMLDYLLSQRAAMGTLPKNGYVVKSIVSSSLCDAICAQYGVELDEVLTGFRYIGEKIALSESDGSRTFLFGFEESYGYLIGTRVRDKDSICAASLITETAVWYASRGMSLRDGLKELFEKYGYYVERVVNYTLYGKEGSEKIAAAMSCLRENPPKSLAGHQVFALRDYLSKERVLLENGNTIPIDLPSSNVLYFEIKDGGWLCVRPSGTEPKLKLYANGSAPTKDLAEQKISAMLDALSDLLAPHLGQ